MSDTNPMAWLPFSIAEATLSGQGGGASELPQAWTRLLDRLKTAGGLVASSDVNRNSVDYASGMRHLMVLLAVGVDEALRVDPDPVLAVSRTSTDDILTWGMECPDCLYLRATLRGGETYRLFGNRGTARYVGLQTMNGIASTANCLVDDLEVDADGDFEIVLSADEHEGNWMRVDGDHPTLVVRHFFYDWDNERPSSLQIERVGAEVAPKDRAVAADVGVSRQIYALGEFIHDNLKFFLDFNGGPPANAFMPPIDRSDMGAAAENRPVIGRYELEPDEALILEVEPPQGVYWSYSLGNQWWETIHYGRHQSSLNAHQAAIDSDGVLRVVISSRDPGVANWLDTAGHSNGAMILRCVRTETAPTPSARVVPFAAVSSELPGGTALVGPEERATIIAARKRAVHERFSA
ncbi:DUF1214 domain-containing protein [Mycolicibacterium tusciae]|uniref:DUF1214 domain-containing protein n=1 Tax=Mycolicibacterium tusciae TaxID=75922 RepID=UPI00024A12B5|nr:DUF1214 domain-containing protein [Mycolicibacterium tusciae]